MVVGYRWPMAEEARRLDVRGWVSNRHNGLVEAIVMGTTEAVNRIVEWARQGPGSAMVAAVDIFAGEGEFDSFEQRSTE
jgi:acylphosphatase